MVDVSNVGSGEVSHVKSIFSPLNLKQRGLCLVSSSPTRSAKPHKLYYEVHGPAKAAAGRLVFIMGLNNSSFGWSNQIELSNRYEMLVFDNRGVGHSEVPEGRLWKTSEMALDTKELLDFLGWKEERSLNIIGVSMGGMIAMELAQIIPERISSLLLTSTHSGQGFRLPSSKATHMFIRLTTGTVWTPEQGIALVVDSLFPPSYLDVPNEEFGTKRKAVERDFMNRYEIGARQSFSGRIGQIAAVFRHHVSSHQLETIAKSIPKIAIITGDEDYLINPAASTLLHENLPGSELIVVKGGGHALPSQIKEEYNAWIERVVSEGIELSKKKVEK